MIHRDNLLSVGGLSVSFRQSVIRKLALLSGGVRVIEVSRGYYNVLMAMGTQPGLDTCR